MKSPSLSERAKRSPDSPIRRLAPLAEGAKARGVNVYHLNIGQPDIEAPPEYFAGIADYASRVVAYDPSRGNAALCAAWSSALNGQLGLRTSASNFVITAGASEALLFAMLISCDAGDEIVVFDPVYANYLGFAAMGALQLVPVRTRIEHGFLPPTIDAVREVLSPKTKAILVCNPNNPSGALISKSLMAELLKLCDEQNLILIADETYREMVYDGAEPFSVLQLDPDNQRVMVVDSFSKRFSLCGSRIGCFLSPNLELVAAAHRMASARLAVSSLEQHAATYLLNHISTGFNRSMTSEFERRRNALYKSLQAIPDAVVVKPQGTFYTIVQLPVANTDEFVKFMLQDFSFDGATTFVAPAAGFYAEPGQGVNQVRIAYVLNAEDLERAITVLGKGLEVFRGRGA